MKRSRDEDDEDLVKKRRTLEKCTDAEYSAQTTSPTANTKATDDTQNNLNDVITIDSLPDDALLYLLSYLNTTDLLQISRCNRRLYNICSDKTLWTKVDAISNGHRPAYAFILPHLHAATVSLKFHKNVTHGEPVNENDTGELHDESVNENDTGELHDESINEDDTGELHDESINEIDTCFGTSFFKKLDLLINLRTLAVTNHNLSREVLSMQYLPASITELRLTRTKVTDSTNFLTKIAEILPNLELIDVSFCQWFNPQFLVPLAKCHNLKTLIMVGCRNMKDIIPYASIAAAYGYRKLETLDMRLTGVVDREIGCFNKIKSLKHVYLERATDIEDNDESITDICTTSLGMRNWVNQEGNDPNANRVLICRIPNDGGNFSDHVLETLVVRNYPRITDITLKHAEKCLRSLKYLDVSGSSCSAEQIAIFRTNRPEVCLTV